MWRLHKQYRVVVGYTDVLTSNRTRSLFSWGGELFHFLVIFGWSRSGNDVANQVKIKLSSFFACHNKCRGHTFVSMEQKSFDVFHPSKGKQNVLARASNNSPHFPHEYPPFLLSLNAACFSICSESSAELCFDKGTVTSSPALINKGLQSSPTRCVFMHNFGCRSFETSTKWIFWRNHLDRLAWFRPTVHPFRSHLCEYFLSGSWTAVELAELMKSSCCCKVSSSKAIWPSCPSFMAGLFEGRAKEEALPFPPQKKSITAPPVMMEGKMEIGLSL